MERKGIYNTPNPEADAGSLSDLQKESLTLLSK